MATELGKFLRRLRIDKDELLKDMAEKLGVSASLLSSIENGKRNPSDSFIQSLITRYGLSAQQISELDLALARTREQVTIMLHNMNEEDQRLALSFARRFATLDEESKERIRRLIREHSSD